MWLKTPQKHLIILGNDSYDKIQATDSVINLTCYVFKIHEVYKNDKDIRQNIKVVSQWKSVQQWNHRQSRIQHENYITPTYNRFSPLGN